MDLQNNGARRNIRDRKPHVLDLRDADVARVADLDDGSRVVCVAEEGADAGDDGPGFADDAGAGRDEEGGFDNVDAVGEIGEFAVGGVGG